MSKKMKKLILGGMALGGMAAAYMVTRRKDTVSIVLKENLAEGFLWMYTVEPQGVIEEHSVDYVPSFEDSKTGESFGQHKWTFAPVKAGEALVKLEYTRPWADKEPPTVTATYRFTVDGDMKLTAELLEHSDNFNEFILSVG